MAPYATHAIQTQHLPSTEQQYELVRSCPHRDTGECPQCPVLGAVLSFCPVRVVFVAVSKRQTTSRLMLSVATAA